LADTIGTEEAIIAKGRNYGVGKFWLKFNPMLTYFSNCDYQNNNNPPLNVPF
jgi:replicative DNA helicase